MIINKRAIVILIHFFFLACLLNIDTIHASILPGIYEGDARTPLLFITLLTTIPFILRNNILNLRINYIIIIIIIFLIYTFINYSLFSLAPDYGLQKFQGLILGIFLGFLLPIIMKYKLIDLKLFFIILLIVDLSIAFIMIAINGLPQSNNFGRLSFGELNTIWLARFYGEIIILLIFIIKNKLIKLILITGFFIGMILTGSKGPIVGLLLIIFVYFLLENKFKPSIQDFYKIPFVILCGLGFLYAIYNLIIIKIADIQFLMYRFSISASEGSYASGGRIGLINLALDYFKESPFWGRGLGSYGFLITGLDYRIYPHNILIESLSELGIIGFVLLITIILIIGVKSYQYYMYYGKYLEIMKVVLIMTLFYFINSMFSGDLGTSNYQLFVYMGYLNYAIIQISYSDKGEENG